MRYTQAKLSVIDRPSKVASVIESLERDMELLCVTGVEDKLQVDVRPTLELLCNAGIKVGPMGNTCQVRTLSFENMILCLDVNLMEANGSTPW